jgi:alkylation response protein AidB-like acyl-CoA dehydrogenase
VPETEKLPDLAEWTEKARAWLEEHAEPRRSATSGDAGWGEGDFNVAVFHALPFAEEQALIRRLMDWNREKYDAGYSAIAWKRENGGQGLTSAYEKAFRREEARFETPDGHEIFSVTTGLMAPAIRAFGTDEQKERLLRPFLRTEVLCCQLFSEPGAGSDLANLGTRAERDGDEWVLNGQKVWSSGAQFSQYGVAICRHDPAQPKHKGQTAFLIDLSWPGVEVRPIRQMSGGSSFNEVFFSDCRVPDSWRLGEVGDGWKVALTILGFERGASSGGGDKAGGSWWDVRALAEHEGVTGDPLHRQALARLYTHYRLMQWNGQRTAASIKGGQTPGPEGSIGKLFWVQYLHRTSAVVGAILGPKLTADSGEWGTFGWNEHLLGAPGYRIAGGSDEIQRNIIGERVLGLPGEPRVDKDLPWKDILRSP